MTSLKEELQTRIEFVSLEPEVYLSLVVTVDRLYRCHAEFMSNYRISPKQYNILRILRGSGKPGLPVMEIGRRMVEKSPDVSRIIDRLIDMGMVHRRRQRSDRRVVRVTISSKGLDLLEKMDAPVDAQITSMFSGMNPEELKTLTQLLDRTRDSLYSSIED